MSYRIKPDDIPTTEKGRYISIHVIGVDYSAYTHITSNIATLWFSFRWPDPQNIAQNTESIPQLIN